MRELGLPLMQVCWMLAWCVGLHIDPARRGKTTTTNQLLWRLAPEWQTTHHTQPAGTDSSSVSCVPAYAGMPSTHLHVLHEDLVVHGRGDGAAVSLPRLAAQHDEAGAEGGPGQWVP